MYKYLPILIFLVTSIFSQTIPQKFFDALIYDKAEICDFINKDELKYSSRLGIEYTGVKNKIFIGYELPDEIKSGIESGKYKYEIKEQPLADSYTEATLSVPETNYSHKYYFKKGFVTNSTYHSRLWEKQESKYFTFRIEEPKYFNEYCVKRLDRFVDLIADTLGFTIAERRILEKEKIGYIFCKDEASVEKITGFRAKGMAMLGTDEIVTSYQTHFHEVAHILINYKLKKLGLYTLPFFMEGFAVAVGGRGGMAPRVITDLGYYLEKSGILTYDSIITNDGFYNNDASISYAVAGLYNSFLLSELGGEKYLELYRKVNGELELVKTFNSTELELPSNDLFRRYLDKYEKNVIFYVDTLDTLEQNVQFTPFTFKSDFVKFFVCKDLLFGPDDVFYGKKLVSKKSKELLDNEFTNHQYYIICDTNSVNVFDFYNDELIYTYNSNLSITPVVIPLVNDRCIFYLRESLFGNAFKNEFHWLIK
ncbi:MAG: hypothetical protein IAE93_12285 [Ignavibacteria bacterium]|nr:hypothetical protein [Ignavibacteria bacterium]